LLTVISLSHAEDVAYRATRGVTDHYQASFQLAEADDPLLTIVHTRVLDLHSRPTENGGRIFEIEAPILQGLFALGRIVGDDHRLVYIQ